MKIIAIVESQIDSGGGFNQSMSAILQLKKICSDTYQFEVFTTTQKNIEVLSDLGIRATRFKYSIFDRFLVLAAGSQWWHPIQKRFQFIGQFERKLLKNKCDLVYFTNPGFYASALQKLNYINTLWDVAQVQTPEFPEVRNYGEYFERERRYKASLSAAYLVLTDSNTLSKVAASTYGVPIDRFLPMPFSVPPCLRENPSQLQSNQEAKGLRKKFNILRPFYFYPAQFWPHKNHIRIIQAIDILKNKNISIDVIFCGGDHGNRTVVEDAVKRSGLQDQVKILGFVSQEDLKVLYRLAYAVIMPTYFGPTNLPPLESWCFGKPLIYSSLFASEVGDAAILVDPDSPSSVADGLLLAQNQATYLQMVENGKRQIKKIDDERKISEEILEKKLEIFARRLQTWKLSMSSI